MENALHAFLQAISIPWVGLTSVGVMAFLAATLIPISSETVFFLYLVQFPENIWVLICVASIGNTLGGMLNWYLGYLAKKARDKIRKPQKLSAFGSKLLQFGPKSLLLSWLPIVGDPLTIYAGWSNYAFLPCCFYMAIGKTLRYLVIAYLYANNQSTFIF
jgi:membrane protein YqaA with SNARE-associated domain